MTLHVEPPQRDTALTDEQVEIRSSRGIAIVGFHTVVDRDLVSRILPDLDRLGERARCVVIDVGDALLLEPEPIAEVVSHLDDHGAACAFACGRVTGRLLLERWGLVGELPVFQSAADAVQAEVMAEEGYGTGWA